jgi:hypothetical protein
VGLEGRQDEPEPPVALERRRRVAVLGEEVPDRAVRVLDGTVDVVERAAEASPDLLTERRLARAHEPHEHEVPS